MVEAVTATLRRLSLLLALIALPCAVFGHRLDEYLQATLVDVEPNDIRLEINFTPGVDVAEQVLALIDRDRNDAISTNEAAAYAESLKRDLTLRLDGRILELKLTASEFPALTELRTGWGIIQVEFSATPGPFAAGAHTLAFENRHQGDVSVYLLNAALPKSDTVQITRQKRNNNQSLGEIDFTFLPTVNAADKGRLVARFGVLIIAVFVAARLWARWRRRRPAAVSAPSDTGA